MRKKVLEESLKKSEFVKEQKEKAYSPGSDVMAHVIKSHVLYDDADPDKFRAKYNPDSGLYRNEVGTVAFRNAVDANKWNQYIDPTDNSQVIVANNKITTEQQLKEKIKKAKGPSATEMWEIYKTTGTGRERAEFKRIEREYNKKNNPKPFYKQPTLKDKPTRKPDALPPGTETVKMQKEPEPPFDLAKYIKEEADKKLKAEQEAWDKQYGKGGIPDLYRPI